MPPSVAVLPQHSSGLDRPSRAPRQPRGPGLVDHLLDRRPHPLRGRGRPAAGQHGSRRCGPAGGAGPATADVGRSGAAARGRAQPGRRVRTPWTRWNRPCRCRRRPPSCSTPAAATGTSGCRDAARSTPGSGCASPGAGGRVTTRPPCSVPAGRGSASGRDACGACTWPTAATRSSERSGRSPAGSCCAAASCCCRERSCWTAGEDYWSPWLVGSWGDGLDELSGRVHRHLRRRPGHPRSPRKALLNTWEAVHFDHDHATLIDLAERAAAVGIERFVLDDGWFRGRTDDRAGLGDWYVDEVRWPDGLHPLVDRVHALGMDFGLWVEPEMVNLDSDLAREHPDWLLQTDHGPGPASRHQHVLDLTRPEVHDYLLERLVGARRGVPGRLRQVGPQPSPGRGRPPPDRPARRPPADPRGLPADGRAALAPSRPGGRVVRRRWRPARPRRPGAQRPGLGVGLPRRPRAAPDGALHRPAAAAGADGHPHRSGTGPHHATRTTAWTSVPPRPSGVTSASSGTSPLSIPTSSTGSRNGSRSTGRYATCSTTVTSCAPTCPTPSLQLDGVVAADRRDALYRLSALDQTPASPPGSRPAPRTGPRHDLPGLRPTARRRRRRGLTPGPGGVGRARGSASPAGCWTPSVCRPPCSPLTSRC